MTAVTDERKEEIMLFCNSMAVELKPVVEVIEASDPITKDHYGRYLSILSQAPTRDERLMFAVALRIAGANAEGVRAALNLT